MLLHSDRIILNSKLDNIYISSKKDIHIGAGEHTTISSGKSIIVNTPDFNIGDPNDEFVDMQPMVLGDSLVNILENIVKIISTIQTGPGMGPTVLNTQMPNIQNLLSKIEEDIRKVRSTKHKIEEG